MLFTEGTIATDKLKFYFDLFSNGPVDNRGTIPFYWCPHSTTSKFPLFVHNLMVRGNSVPASPLFEYFEKIVFEFLSSKNIKHGKTIRACLNLTYHIPGYEFIDPHVDNFCDHYIVILYLNNTDGNTLVFDKKYTAGDRSVIDYDSINLNEYKIKKEITPKIGKIVCFDGIYYHALRLPSPGNIRTICIFNISK